MCWNLGPKAEATPPFKMPYPVTNVKHEVEVPYSYIQPLLYKEIFNFREVRRIHSIKIEGRSDWGKRKIIVLLASSVKEERLSNNVKFHLVPSCS
jgi:hypothetical protein